MKYTAVIYRFSCVMVCAILLSSCHEEAPQQWNQVQEYAVLKMNKQEVTLKKTYPAIVEGREDIEIRPRIDGYIETIYVDEGASVKQGDILFRINAPQYAEYLKSAKAAVKNAEIQVNKAKPLVEEGIINKYELDAAELNLEAQKAALAKAQSDAGFTTIKSPVNGVVGRIPYRTGSLVNPQLQIPLTVVSDISKVHVYFTMDEREYFNFYSLYEGNTLEEKLKNFPQVQLQLPNGEILEEKGNITAISGVLDRQTGSARFRATFPNKHQKIRSGGSGTIIIPNTIENAMTVPQRSTFELQDKHMVYKVINDRVFTTEIEIMPTSTAKEYVVTKGLSTGDLIVYESAGSLRDSVQIQPKLMK